MVSNPTNEDLLDGEIKNFVLTSSRNRIPGFKDAMFFEEPIVGFANARDPIFVDYKRIIGEFHLTPLEYLDKIFPEEEYDNGSVISWILPLNEETRKSNRLEIKYPSKRWALTRELGEEFNNEVGRHVIGFLQKKAFNAVAPGNSDIFKVASYKKVGRASNWSERHIAYACGLGTFSLSNGFITEKGIAMRCGSVITNLKLKPSRRGYKNHLENCLFYRKSPCRVCIKRCPAGAISEKGNDKRKCRNYIKGTIEPYAIEYYRINTPGCGLCQTNVPCESRIP